MACLLIFFLFSIALDILFLVRAISSQARISSLNIFANLFAKGCTGHLDVGYLNAKIYVLVNKDLSDDLQLTFIPSRAKASPINPLSFGVIENDSIA